jgi:hypothetical protein
MSGDQAVMNWWIALKLILETQGALDFMLNGMRSYGRVFEYRNEIFYSLKGELAKQRSPRLLRHLISACE